MDKLIYNRDVLVARVDQFYHVNWVRKELAPLYLQMTENFVGWLQGRCIDSHRGNSRLLKRALGISEKSDEEIVLEVNAATVTDTYWVKEEDSALTWEEVDFTKAEFSGLALTGTYNDYCRAQRSKTRKTPKLTNTGSFEKCWRMRDGEWWLYKEGNPNELFSELFAYRLGKELGFAMAEYRLGTRYIKPGTRCILSRDFTQRHRYNFEPIVALVGDSPDDYQRTYQKIYKLSPKAASDYVSLLFMDALLCNPDRHEYNFGFLSDPMTGDIIGLAPNFDNNMALIARGYYLIPLKQEPDPEKNIVFVSDSQVVGEKIFVSKERIAWGEYNGDHILIVAVPRKQPLLPKPAVVSSFLLESVHPEKEEIEAKLRQLGYELPLSGR